MDDTRALALLLQTSKPSPPLHAAALLSHVRHALHNGAPSNRCGGVD